MTIISELYELLKLKSDVEYKLDGFNTITFGVGEVEEGWKWCSHPGKINLHFFPGWKVNAGELRASSTYYDPKKLQLEEIADKINKRVIKHQKKVKEGQVELARKQAWARSSARMEENLINSFTGGLSPEDLTIFKGKKVLSRAPKTQAESPPAFSVSQESLDYSIGRGLLTSRTDEWIRLEIDVTPQELVRIINFLWEMNK